MCTHVCVVHIIMYDIYIYMYFAIFHPLLVHVASTSLFFKNQLHVQYMYVCMYGYVCNDFTFTCNYELE